MRYQVEMEPFFNMLAYIEYILGFVIRKPRYHTRDVILDCNVKDVWACMDKIDINSIIFKCIV